MGTYPKIRNQGECDPGTWTERKRSSRLPQDETAPKLTKTILKRFVDSPAIDGFSKEKLSDNEAQLTMHLKALLGSEADPKLKATHKEIAKAVRDAISDARLGKPRRTRRIALPDDAVTHYITLLLADTGIAANKGIAHVHPDTEVDLEPLAQYIRCLQNSPEIPNYFHGMPNLRLDALYVELTACDALRANQITFRQCEAHTSINTDPIAQWKSTARTKQILVDTLLASTDTRPAVLFGDPGSGKTTLILFALHSLGKRIIASDLHATSIFLPFHISLDEFARDGAEVDFDIAKYIARKALGITNATALITWRTVIESLLKTKHRVFLLLDGIDQVTSNRKLFSKIHKTIKAIEPTARILVTSRREGFTPITLDHSPFELVDLCRESISSLISNWFRTVCPKPPKFIECFQRWVLEDANRREMAANPSLLSLLCFLNQDCTENTFIQARNRAEMYQRAVDKLTSDPRAEKSMRRDPALDTLARFALDRYTSLGPTRVQSTLFNSEEIRHFLSRLGKSHKAQQSAPSFAGIEERWLNTRIITQFNHGAWYHFLHLSFQEYFAALGLMDLDIGDVALLIDTYQFNPFWAEVWRFYSGLCALAGGSGISRYTSLARKYILPEDIFRESLWFLAPLMTENGVQDSRHLLGFDLRTVLLRDVEYGSADQESRVRVMASIDPRFFLDHSISVLTPLLEYYKSADEKMLIEYGRRTEVRIALEVLQCLYQSEAVEFYVSLVIAQVNSPAPILSDPWSTISFSGVVQENASLEDALLDCLNRGVIIHRTASILIYLGQFGTKKSVDHILKAAHQFGLREFSPEVSPDELLDIRIIRLACLGALCRLQAPQSIDLATQLWRESWFREGLPLIATDALLRFRNPAVGELARVWLEEAGAMMDSVFVESVLKLIPPWMNDNVPACVEKLISPHSKNVWARAEAWTTVLNKGGLAGRERIRLHLLQFCRHRKLTRHLRIEIKHILSSIGDVRPVLFNELIILNERQQDWNAPDVSAYLNFALTWICIQFPLVREHHEWLKSHIVPELHRLLGQGTRAHCHLSRLLCALQGAPTEIVGRVAHEIRVNWFKTSKSAHQYLLEFFFCSPDLAPTEFVESARNSVNKDLRIIAIGLLLRIDPGRIVRESHNDAEVSEYLRCRTKTYGFLYFEDRLFSPETLRFERYKFSNVVDDH